MTGRGPAAEMGRRRALALLAALLAAPVAAACAAAPPAPLARLTVRAPGIYRLDAADLAAAGLGWQGVDPLALRLHADGAQLEFAQAAPPEQGTREEIRQLCLQENEDGERHSRRAEK